MAEFRMPSLGSDMVSGTLIEWRVKPGDRVERGDIIAVVDTDKAAIEIEVFDDGVVEQLLVEPGQTVAVGTVMAIIRSEMAAAPTEAIPTPVAERVSAKPATELRPEIEEPHPAETAAPAPPSPKVGTEHIKASPYARKLAAAHCIDLSVLRGAGPGGAIGAGDVERAINMTKPELSREPVVPPIAKEAHATPEEPVPGAEPAVEKPAVTDYQAGMRRAIAAAMARSNREIPHYYLQMRIDMSRTLRWLESENLKRPIQERILSVVPLIKAVALALGDVPELNGYWMDDRHQPQEAINIGFAIALRLGGLITPALFQVDLKNLDELMAALRDLITRTRAGKLRGSEMTEATITVTSLGDLGVETVYGVIYPPQVALVGFGKIMEQPWAESGMLAVRPVLTATLAADHRATDGRRGAQFLDALNRYLQEPSRL
jgi:pyruvate dehydrogenase E2 component (dihydrolipoyllysine-residue acetyltransferase)